MVRPSFIRAECSVGSVFRRKSVGVHLLQQLAHKVLSGLLYSECELYIDDIIAFASSEEELLERLHRLFERLRKYNVTLNPDKCEIGLDHAEYVGHLINAEGMHFTRKKLESRLCRAYNSVWRQAVLRFNPNQEVFFS
jgi:hypothetical protein